jgi:hypothetical protein
VEEEELEKEVEKEEEVEEVGYVAVDAERSLQREAQALFEVGPPLAVSMLMKNEVEYEAAMEEEVEVEEEAGVVEPVAMTTAGQAVAVYRLSSASPS